MKYSIVIPTLNCASELHRLLDSIQLFDVNSQAEIIVVDGGSRDKTIPIAKKFKTTLIVNKGVTKGEARNIGIKHSKGDIIINIDSDTILSGEWFPALVRAMKEYKIVAGYSPHPKRGDIPRVPIMIDGQDITWPFCNIAHHKEVFEKVGYIKDTEFSEDIDFNYRCIKAGYIIHYEPQMKLWHNHTINKKAFMKQAFLYGRCRAIINRRYPELTHKHQHGASLRNVIRLGFGGLGYVYEKIGCRGT